MEIADNQHGISSDRPSAFSHHWLHSKLVQTFLEKKQQQQQQKNLILIQDKQGWHQIISEVFSPHLVQC